MPLEGAPAPSPPDDVCGLCGGRGRPFREKYGYPILECSRCGNAFVPRALVPIDLEGLYSKAYFEGEHATGYPGYLRDRELLLANFRDRLAWIQALSPPGKRILDVGAAYGLFLRAARDLGWEGSGVEIAPDCAVEAARLSGVSVACGDFATVPLAGPFDVIVMLDVIEHFRDPVKCIRRAFDLLGPRGLFVVETGDIATPWARLFGNRWHFLDPPQHLFYFSRSGLLDLLFRAGFSRDVSVRRSGRRVSVTNIAFKLAAGAPAGPIKATLTRASRTRVGASVYLNFGDGMFVAARRP